MSATNVVKEDEQQNQLNEPGHFYRHFQFGLREVENILFYQENYQKS